MLRIKEMELVEDPLAPKSSVSTRDGFGKGLLEAGEENPNVWVLTADVTESTRVNWFSEKFPKYLFHQLSMNRNHTQQESHRITLSRM